MVTKKIGIIGLGYVGFPLLIALTNKTKHTVVGFDISKKNVTKIQNGICPIIDAQSELEFKKSKKLHVSSDENSIKGSDVFIICVPTPVNSDFDPDYTPLINASKSVSKYLKKGDIVVVESTINPGTCEEVVAPAIEEVSKLKLGKDYNIVHSPERINPGDKTWNVTNLPRNIGGSSLMASKTIKSLYSEFITAELKVVSNLKVAEASKIIENSFRDLNIAFVNELAKSFDAMGVDLIETIEAASSKFSFMPHWPGPGVGGHCIAVDPYYLIKRAAKSGFNHRLLKEARNINNSMPDYSIKKLNYLLNDLQLSIKGTRMALLGLSYKPEVGDLRESPSLIIGKKLTDLGAKLNVYEPFVLEKSNVKTLDKAIAGCKAIIITTAHKEFIEKLTPKYLKDMGVKAVLDTRSCLDAKGIKSQGIIYSAIGRS